MMRHRLNQMFAKPMFGSPILVLIILTLSAADGWAQVAANPAWPLLEAAQQQKSSAQRAAAVRVLGFVPNDPRVTELAERALKDPNSSVRAAAATALGQMHATDADPILKQALNDKSLSVVMAAAHALHSLNDPACYDVYYEVLTGERKNDTGMVAQEMKVLHDPKQVAQMGFSEGIGYVPFAGIGWGAFQTIMKDRKSGAAAKAALISAIAADPDARTGKVLVTTSGNKNWVLRIAALEAIAKRGDPTLLSGIEPRLSDSRREVRYAAAATVIRLEDVAEAKASDAKVAPPTLGGQPELHTSNTAGQATR